MKKSSGSTLRVITRNKTISGTFDLIEMVQKSDAKEMLLLESADIVTKVGEKSMLFLDMALKLESRDDRVAITALVKEAEPLLKELKARLPHEIVDSKNDSLTLAIEPLYHHLDLLEKMHARSALDALRAVLASLELEDSSFKKNLMLSGVFSYDFLDHFEKLPKANQDIHNFPDYLFFLPLTAVVVDHREQTTSVISHAIAADGALDEAARLAELRQKSLVIPALSQNPWNGATPILNQHADSSQKALKYSTDIPDKEFFKVVEACKEHINAGDVYQIVPSRTFDRPIKDPIACYQALRHLNPSPYMFYVRTDEWSLFGASPETFIKVDKEGSRVSIRPIAGTRRRGFNSDGGIDDELDSREQASLCLDEKELAEHMMLVDLARNDIASIAKPSTRRIKRLLAVDRFSHVMHLVSEVEGILQKGFDALSAYQASMNMGTLMGAPKVRAAELLRKLERTKRGFYGGAVGYIDQVGDMDTAIIIRSALVRGNTAYVRAGCGVVFDSNAQFEAQETINKAEAVLRAINIAGDV